MYLPVECTAMRTSAGEIRAIRRCADRIAVRAYRRGAEYARLHVQRLGRLYDSHMGSRRRRLDKKMYQLQQSWYGVWGWLLDDLEAAE